MNKEDQKLKPEVHSIMDLLHNEKIRLMKKGSQILVGLGITIFFFCCLPKLVFPLYSLISVLDPLILVLIGISATGSMNLLVYNLVMNHIYAQKYPYFEQYRIMNKPWPWEIDEKAYSKQYREIVTNTIIGSVFISPMITYSSVYFNLIEYRTDIESYPSSIEIFKELMFMSLVVETLYYWSHRLFHTPWLYKNFHKQHHEYQVTVSIAAIYNNPFDYVITNTLPAIIAKMLLCEMHVVTAYFWGLYVGFLAIVLHIGYNMPWYPFSVFPFGIDIDYHDFHHSSNVGNYGIFSSLWDTICGTNSHYNKFIASKEKKNS